MGAFDLVACTDATRAQPWARYDGVEMALDIKLTGASCVLGANGPTMRAYMSHARQVLKAARKSNARVGSCGVVAFLLRRPSGLNRDGRALAGSFGFIALDVEALLSWCPNTTVRAPAHI